MPGRCQCCVELLTKCSLTLWYHKSDAICVIPLGAFVGTCVSLAADKVPLRHCLRYPVLSKWSDMWKHENREGVEFSGASP